MSSAVAAVPATCCGREGGCACAKEAKCSCGKNAAMHCDCEKSSMENQLNGARCSCRSCTCEGTEAGSDEGATDFTNFGKK
ncbi:hypothetical protein LTR28_009074 [Elasticomyces elasticus]|nr:hypothetical protein LTR28_009074 [Elasticomyces elasticus]